MKKNTIIFFTIFFLLMSIPLAIAEEILTWQDSLKESAKNHPDLISAQEKIIQQQSFEQKTASALFPQLDADLSAAKTEIDTDSGRNLTESYSYGLTGTQIIFDANKTFNNIKIAKENIKAAKEFFEFTSADVRLKLRTAFINLLSAQEMLQISEEIYFIRKNSFELIKLRYESGLEHKGAYLTAEANLEQARLEKLLAARQVELYQKQLLKEMGRTENSMIKIKGDFEIKEYLKICPAFEIILQNHPSFKQILAQENAAELGIRVAKANYIPTVSGQAGAQKNDSHFSPQDDEWNWMLKVSLPIFEGGLRSAEVSSAKALFNQFKADERSLKDTLIFALEQTWLSLQTAIDNVEIQKKFLIANEERSKIASAQYDTGFITFDNWIIIEDALVKSKRDFLEAKANALLAEANWIYAKGETLEYE